MNMRNTTARFGLLSVTLLWLMLLLIVAVYSCIDLRGYFPKGSETREALKTWHFMLGLSVFVLVWLRLLVSATSTVPRIEPTPPKWKTLLAKIMRVALYVLMVSMPILGWFLLSASGKPIPFFGLELPALVAKNKEFADLIKEIHETGGTIGYFITGLHAAAALFHHYFVRDNTLRRMLPIRD